MRAAPAYSHGVRAFGPRAVAGLCLMAAWVAADSLREFQPTPGYVRADSLPEEFSALVLDVDVRILDAFDGSRASTGVEEDVFEWGNSLHIDSKPSTIRKRLLFGEGDVVDRDILLETERQLRQEMFLADAIVEIREDGKGGADVVVTTYDQWTTVPAVGVQYLGGEWVYWLGLVESNLVGTGQKIGAFFSHELERDRWWGQYENKALVVNNLRLFGLLGQSTDGFNYEFALRRPLVSKNQRWSFELEGTGTESSAFYYLDADRPAQAGVIAGAGGLTEAPNPAAGDANLLSSTKGVVDMDFSANLSRVFGHDLQLVARVAFDWNERFLHTSQLKALRASRALGGGEFARVPRALELDRRRDYLPGIYLSLMRREYKTVKNFRNLKWSEDLDVGFKVATGIARNVESLGARNDDFFLNHTLTYIDLWRSKHFLTTSLGLSYFLGTDGEFEDGRASHVFEYQWKPVPLTATYVFSSWNHYFAREPSAQLLLGEYEGLNGYPNRFFAGQARLLMQLEQRLFPPWEFGTYVPALAVFGNAGDTWPGYDSFDWNDLHFSAGIGLRLGATRSTQKVVNHFNLAFPIDSKYSGVLSPTVSIRALASL